MKRRRVTLQEVREMYRDEYMICYGEDVDTMGICALVDVENMGFCRDGVTRWYHFDLDGEPCVYYKY